MALALLGYAPANARTAQSVAVQTSTSAPVAPALALHPALWKVADNDTTIWLFGTVHVMKPGLDWLEGPVAAALDGSNELITEVVEPQGPRAQAALIDHATLPAGPSLRDLLGPDRLARFDALLRKTGLKADALDRFKPWYAAVVLSSLPMVQRGLHAEDGAEAQLVAHWTDLGSVRTRGGLETVDYQLGLFDSLPADAQLAYLDTVIENYDQIGPQIDQLFDAWGKGDGEALAKVMNADMDDPRLTQTLITGRNRQWAKWIAQRLATPGSVFVAVGAGHLAGPGSVQEQLVRAGLTVTRVQ